MRLVQCVSHSTVSVRVTCESCAGRFYVSYHGEPVFADLDGPAFRAYFCAECAPVVREEHEKTGKPYPYEEA